MNLPEYLKDKLGADSTVLFETSDGTREFHIMNMQDKPDQVREVIKNYYHEQGYTKCPGGFDMNFECRGRQLGLSLRQSALKIIRVRIMPIPLEASLVSP